MTPRETSARPSVLAGWLQSFSERPRLVSALGVGLLAVTGLSAKPDVLRWSTRAVIAWDLAALCFLVSLVIMMDGCGMADLQARAAKRDEGRGFILGLTVAAATASVCAIGVQLGLAKADHGWLKATRVALAFVTIALSWLFVHFIFALHYAHEYYGPEPLDVDGDGLRQGLTFPGNEPPDYWDFVHFALVIGVACQTADIAFTSKTMRRTGTLHSLISFAFNTVVLALTINLLAGLF